MELRYYVYGEVVFTTTAKRSAAGRRLDQRAAKAGFTPEVWQGLLDAYGSWPAGRADLDKIDDQGVARPAMRFCYMTRDAAIAAEAQADVAAAWDVFQDTDSFWAFAAIPDA